MCSKSCECDPTPAKQPEISASSSGISKLACRRCGSEPFIILDKVHVDCKSCFLESCNKKIRSTIGKSKLMRNNDRILLAYSGGTSSEVLLDLIKCSIEGESRREQKFRPSIIHVDTQSIISTPVAERIENLKRTLARTSRKYPDWPLFWTSLEMVETIHHNSDLTNDDVLTDNNDYYCRYEPDTSFSDNDPKSRSLLTNNEALVKLDASLRPLDLTGKQELVAQKTNALINKVASDLNSSISKTTIINENNASEQDKFKFVFVGSSATQLANDLLVSVILGHGSSIRSVVGVCDQRNPVPIVRPMRDFSKKEIAFYAIARGLLNEMESSLAIPTQANLATFAQRKASIQTVTEAFLSKLYVDYPATYSTLLRTGNKMQDS